MKRIIPMLFIGVLFILFVAAAPQEKMTQQKNANKPKQMQMMQMMQDSTMMDMMMEHIARNDHMRLQMMQKMIEHVRNDSTAMLALASAIAQEPGMRWVLTQMMKDTERVTETRGKEILIRFKPGTNEKQIQNMADEIGLHQTKEIKALNVRVFSIVSNKSVAEVIEHCQKQPFVLYAEPNQSYKAQNDKPKR